MAFVVDRIDHVVLNCRDVDATIDWYVGAGLRQPRRSTCVPSAR